MDVAAFLLALVPIIWLVVMLLCFKWPAWKAAMGSFALSCVLAFAWWHLPAAQIATASLEGFLMALWPIVLVIIAAVFTYNLCVRTGAMGVIGSMITSISSDRRLLALLVAWCFGGFMEGMAGFGTAVAIPAGMLAGLGFEAVPAVLICLLANGVPTPYGSIGIPTVSVAGLVGLDPLHLATVQLVQLAPFFVVMPLFIVLVAAVLPMTRVMLQALPSACTAWRASRCSPARSLPALLWLLPSSWVPSLPSSSAPSCRSH